MYRKLIAGAIAATLTASCQASGSAAAPCRPGGHLLATEHLTTMAPSAPFVVPPGATTFVSTSASADPEQLFSGLAGVIDVSVTAAGQGPHVTTDEGGAVIPDDPTVTLRSTGAWYRLPVSGGTWRIYTADLGANGIPVRVIACASH